MTTNLENESQHNPRHRQHKHILLCYKNFSKETAISHIGMGVTAQYNSKSLMAAGFLAEAKPIYGADDLTGLIQAMEGTNRPVTHVVIMAQWIGIKHLSTLVRQFPHIVFANCCHSNVGFLSAEPPAIDHIRNGIDLETGVSNFHSAANNLRLQAALQNMYNRPITYLPNLYYLSGHEPIHRPIYTGGPIRIGLFGSLRIYKNFGVAVSAAVQLINRLKTCGEIWINSGRSDGAGNVIHRTAVAWTKNLPNVTLKELHWASWPEFKRMTGSMNILFQPSFSETFNNVTADGICEGTPSVVGPSIEWCPKSYKAEPDDATEVADVARRLLYDHNAAHEGYEALKHYVKQGLPHWEAFLNNKR